MELTTNFEVVSGFVKIPNELTQASHPLWSKPAAMQLFLSLLALGHRKGIQNQEHLAKILGMTHRTLRKNLKPLRDLGYLSVDGDALVLSLDRTETPILEKSLDIAKEVAEKANRESTGLTQKDRWELIKKAWNTHKPEGYLQLDGSVSTPLFIAIETHTKRLQIERDDYDGFIGAVLRGAAADPWWSTKEMKASQVFGFGAELDNRKFENVEKLFRAGGRIAPVEPEFEWSDQNVVDWYVLNFPPMKGRDIRVLRIDVKDEREAKDIEDWKRYRNSEPREEACFKRQIQNQIESGNLKIDEDWYAPGTIRLYYVDKTAAPIYWSEFYNVGPTPGKLCV